MLVCRLTELCIASLNMSLYMQHDIERVDSVIGVAR